MSRQADGGGCTQAKELEEYMPPQEERYPLRVIGAINKFVYGMRGPGRWEVAVRFRVSSTNNRFRRGERNQGQHAGLL